MAEPVFGLTRGAANLLGEIANKHRQRLPDAGRRTRRVAVPAPPVAAAGGAGPYHLRKLDPETGEVIWSTAIGVGPGSPNNQPNNIVGTTVTFLEGQGKPMVAWLTGTVELLDADDPGDFEAHSASIDSKGDLTGTSYVLMEDPLNASDFYMLKTYPAGTGNALVRFNSSFVEQWASFAAVDCRGAAVDSAGNGYFGVGTQVRKVDSSGTTITNFSLAGGSSVIVLSLAVNGSVFVITSNVVSSLNIRCYDKSTGASQWTALYSGSLVPNGVAIDGSGNVVVVGPRSQNYGVGVGTTAFTVKFYNSSGSVVWTADTIGDGRRVQFDSDGNVVVVHQRGTLYSATKFTSGGSVVWRFDHGGGLCDLAFSDSGDLYVVGLSSLGLT